MATRNDTYGKTINLVHIFGVAPVRAAPTYMDVDTFHSP